MKKRDIRVSDAMIKPVLVYEDDSIATLKRKLKAKETNVVLVVDRKKHFLGEITEEELLKKFVPEHLLSSQKIVGVLGAGVDRSYFAETAHDLMLEHNYTVTKKTPMDKVLWLVYAPGFRFIPVLNDKKQVIGVITPSSLLDAFEYKQ
ncbi:CBS domain-containing protein [Candidatus Woesearchaeota archaeon]|nr:CBS domain-containing protein [Candidatus Woesearchaeota archaeon]